MRKYRKYLNKVQYVIMIFFLILAPIAFLASIIGFSYSSWNSNSPYQYFNPGNIIFLVFLPIGVISLLIFFLIYRNPRKQRKIEIEKQKKIEEEKKKAEMERIEKEIREKREAEERKKEELLEKEAEKQYQIAKKKDKEKIKNKEIWKRDWIKLQKQLEAEKHTFEIKQRELESQKSLLSYDCATKLGISPKGLTFLKPDEMIATLERMETYTGIYIIYNKTRSMYYVGQGQNVLNRIKNHFYGRGGNADVYADYKYGNEMYVTFKPLSSFTGCNSLDKAEQWTISRLRCVYPNGYNKTTGNN